MGIFKNLTGILGNLFQIGGTLGPQVKNNSGVLEARNSDDSGYTQVRVLAGVDDNDAITFKQLKSTKGVMVVKRQADCSAALPNNTATKAVVVVTTAGTGTSLGDLLWDDGSSAGTMEILSAVEGYVIATTDALTGGTISFDPDSLYCWDEDGGSWVKIGDIGSVTGSVREIRFILDNSASQDSTSTIPANARVIFASIETTTAYSGGATITMGTTASASLFQGTTDNDPQTNLNIYAKEQDTGSGAASVLRITIAGAPAAGAGVAVVRYISPNA